jgi:hypothetical protein
MAIWKLKIALYLGEILNYKRTARKPVDITTWGQCYDVNNTFVLNIL